MNITEKNTITTISLETFAIKNIFNFKKTFCGTIDGREI